MEYKLNNAEFVLLLLISEPDISNGYQIRVAITQRGMETWAGVSASSIYVMLKKLEQRSFVSSSADTDKQTKGATGRVYALTKTGKTALLHAIRHGLSATREHDARFNIALSGITHLPCPKAIALLQERHAMLGQASAQVRHARTRQGALPIPAQLLFDHAIAGIEAHLIWLDRTISKLIREGYAA